VKIAQAMAKLGATDFELAQELGVTTQTVWRWRSKYPEFCYALDEGKEEFDNRIERSLAMKAPDTATTAKRSLWLTVRSSGCR
jgi:transposase-like protein